MLEHYRKLSPLDYIGSLVGRDLLINLYVT